MKLFADHLSRSARSLPNFFLLEDFLSTSEMGDITGFVTLGETLFLKHVRLIFVGTGEFAETVLHGPSFSPVLFANPGMASELREILGEFLRQIRELQIPSCYERC